MRTAELEVYTFSELSPKVKQKVIEANRNHEVEFDGWWEGVYEVWQEKLKEQGFLSCKIWFRGFSSQGDGACFDCDDFNIGKLIAGQKFNAIEAEVLRLMIESVHIKENGCSNHYCHENTRDFCVSEGADSDVPTLLRIPSANLTLFDQSELEDPQRVKNLYELLVKYPELPRPDVAKLVIKFERGVEELRRDLCKQIYRALEAEYDYFTSDEFVTQYLEDCDYEFTAEGERWKW